MFEVQYFLQCNSQPFSILKLSGILKIMWHLSLRSGQSSWHFKSRGCRYPKKTTWQKIKTEVLQMLLVMLIIVLAKSMPYSVKYGDTLIMSDKKFQQYQCNL